MTLVNKLVIQNLTHRPIRTLLCVFAIALQVTMILTLVGVSEGTPGWKAANQDVIESLSYD